MHFSGYFEKHFPCTCLEGTIASSPFVVYFQLVFFVGWMLTNTRSLSSKVWLSKWKQAQCTNCSKANAIPCPFNLQCQLRSLISYCRSGKWDECLFAFPFSQCHFSDASSLSQQPSILVSAHTLWKLSSSSFRFQCNEWRKIWWTDTVRALKGSLLILI